MYQNYDTYLQVAKYRNADAIRRAQQWQMARDAQRRRRRDRALLAQQTQELLQAPALTGSARRHFWGFVLRSLRPAS